MIWLALPQISAAQQITARVAGLEDNAEYMEMLRLEKQLQREADSVVATINTTRQLYTSDPANRQKYGREILRLETALFEVRNNAGVLASKITAIEQEYVLQNLNGNRASAGSAAAVKKDSAQVRNLVYNRYFKENLPPADYQTLIRSQTREMLPLQMLKRYAGNYTVMDTLARAYRSSADKDSAADIYARYRTALAYQAALADSVAEVWGYIYENKIYNYNYLLDRMNKIDQLSKLERQFQDGSYQIASVRDKVMSEAVYAYPIRKKLVLSYELALAGVLGYTGAADSIGKMLVEVNKLSYDFPKIELEERYFIEYAAVEFPAVAKYNARNPIPPNEVYPKGTVYKILVGTYPRVQPLSIFRTLSPLSYEELEDGSFRYYAGSYADQTSALAAVETLKKRGYRTPGLVVWRDGVYENLSAATGEAAFYRVEISGAGTALSEAVKKIIAAAAEGKEVSRLSGPEGEYIYTVGSFDSKMAADKLVAALEGAEGIRAKVLAIEN